MPRLNARADALSRQTTAARGAFALAVVTCAMLWVATGSGQDVLADAQPPARVEPPAAGSPPSATAVAPAAERPATPAGTPAAARADAAPPPELSPYTVRVALHVARDATLDSRFCDGLAAQLAILLRSALGQMWSSSIAVAQNGVEATPEGLKRLSDDDLTARYVAAGCDKALLVGIARRATGLTVAVREWDAATQTAGPLREASTFDPRLAAALAAELIVDAFRPLVVIGGVEGRFVDTAVRAGEFPPADPQAVPFKTGDLLVPFVRYYDRDRNLQQIRHLPWTYLRVEEIERGRMRCELVSAYRTPLAGSRRRMELMAIAARPASDSTRLVIAPRGDTTNPLPGCRVEVLNRLPSADDPVEDRQLLLTNRLGAIVIPFDAAHPLQHVIVHSGKSIVARVPLVPGLEQEMTLAIPDDAPRLAVEGALSVLEGELIDAVSRRSVLMARARRAARSRQWQEVDMLLEQLKAIPDFDAFRARVAAIQLPAIQSARELGDRVAEARIRKMCADLQQVAAGHLDADKIREFRAEMAELRSATQ